MMVEWSFLFTWKKLMNLINNYIDALVLALPSKLTAFLMRFELYLFHLIPQFCSRIWLHFRDYNNLTKLLSSNCIKMSVEQIWRQLARLLSSSSLSTIEIIFLSMVTMHHEQRLIKMCKILLRQPMVIPKIRNYDNLTPLLPYCYYS